MTEDASQYQEHRLAGPIFILVLMGASLFLYLRTFLLSGVPLVAHDDQLLFFVRAARMVHGQVLYRDFFELVPPGIDLLYAAGFRVFGIHAWVMQAWCIALGVALFWVITEIAGTILKGPLVLLPGLLFLVFDFDSALDPTHHWYSTLAALGAVAVLTRGASLRRILAAGVLCGAATLFTQTQGALTFAALVLYLIWLRRSEDRGPDILTRLVALALPFFVMLAIVLGYYVFKAGFHTVFSDLIFFPVRFMSSAESNSPRTYLRQLPPLHSVADLVRLIPSVFIYAVVPYVYFFGVHRLWRGRNLLSIPIRQRLVLLNLVGLALFLAVANGPRLHRLCTVAPPAILVCVWLVSQPGTVHRLVRYSLCVLGCVYAVLLPVYRQTQWHGVLNLPVGRTAFTDPLEFHEFQWLAEHTHPSESFFNEPVLALYLALDNPTASEFVNNDEFSRPEQVAAVIESLRRHPARYIVLYPASTGSLDVHDHSGPFRQYVHDNYRLVEVFPLDHHSRYEELWAANHGSSD
jgi:hypothetical protein